MRTASFCLEGSLGGGNGAFSARVALDRHAQRPRKGLEHRLALVMCVVAAQVVDMERHLRMIDEALEELVHEVDVEFADQATRELDVVFEPWPSGKIDD